MRPAAARTALDLSWGQSPPYLPRGTKAFQGFPPRALGMWSIMERQVGRRNLPFIFL
jgi:hypothetical protein